MMVYGAARISADLLACQSNMVWSRNSGLESGDPGPGVCVMPLSVALVRSLLSQPLDQLQNKGQLVEWFPNCFRDSAMGA